MSYLRIFLRTATLVETGFIDHLLDAEHEKGHLLEAGHKAGLLLEAGYEDGYLVEAGKKMAGLLLEVEYKGGHLHVAVHTDRCLLDNRHKIQHLQYLRLSTRRTTHLMLGMRIDT